MTTRSPAFPSPEPIRFRFRTDAAPPADVVPPEVTAAFNDYALVAERVDLVVGELAALPARFAEANAADASAAADALRAGKQLKTPSAAKVAARYDALIDEHETLRALAENLGHAYENAVAAFLRGPARDEVARLGASLESRLDSALEPLLAALGEFNDAAYNHDAARAIVKASAGTGGRWAARWQIRPAIDTDAVVATIHDTIAVAIGERS